MGVPQLDGWTDRHPSGPQYLHQARFALRTQRDEQSMNVVNLSVSWTASHEANGLGNLNSISHALAKELGTRFY